MSDSRRRARDTSDNEIDPPSRIVPPRRSIFFEESDPVEHIERMETEPSEDSDPNEEQFEDEEEPHPNSPSLPPAFPSLVPSSPIIPSSPISASSIPPSTYASHRQVDARRWDWMPQVLEHWRQDEQIPILPEALGPRTPIPSLTQEPVHHTIPVLITRLLSHERILERLEQAELDRMDVPTSEVELLQHQVSNELAEQRDMVVTAHDDGVQARDEVALFHQQLEESQHRISELEREMAAMRIEREQLRADAGSSARLADLLGNMGELLR